MQKHDTFSSPVLTLQATVVSLRSRTQGNGVVVLVRRLWHVAAALDDVQMKAENSVRRSTKQTNALPALLWVERSQWEICRHGVQLEVEL